MSDVVVPTPTNLHERSVAAVATSSEPTVVAIVGAPFGDLEFDVGKSVRWSEFFSDKLFILDVNIGTPRYWIVNWTMTFPDSENAVTSIDFFTNPVQFRKDQWAKTQVAFPNLPDDAWVLWVDGSEGISFDNRSLPNDYDISPFMSFIWREITRAGAADNVVIPFFVFLRSDELQNVTYDQLHLSPDVDAVLQPVSVPYYLPYQGLKRLIRVSALRNPAFDWASIDAPATPSAGVKAQIVSYAYAHWALDDIPPGQSDVPELVVENDDGWRMRQQISLVRPIAGLPFSEEPPYTPATAKLWLKAANFTPTSWPSGGATPIVMTQSDQTKRPALVNNFANGLPAVRFASKDSMSTIDPLLDQQGDWMIACVVATRSSNSDGMVWMFGRELALQRRAFWAHGATGEIGFSGYNSNTLTTTTSAVPTIVLITRRTGVITIYVNGASIVSGSPTLTPFVYNGFAVGANVSGSEGWSGDMAELIVAATTDTLTQLSIEGYLAWRYGLQASLPPGHLFANAPPSSSGGTSPWNPSNDVVGVPGPWAADITIATDPGFTPVTDTPPTPAHATAAGVRTPLYDCSFRLNMRDGVWYENGVSGNTPLAWDSVNGKWVTPYDPDYWPDFGVGSGDNPDYVDPPTPGP